MTVVDTFERIIRHQSVHQLVPVLLALDKKEQLAVRAKTKALHKELTEIRQLGSSTWGRTGTEPQLAMLFLAGVATYTRKEALGLTEPLGMHWGEGNVRAVNQDFFFSVAEHARPNWFGEWFERRSRGGPWGLPEYFLLREMEARKLIDHEPALFSRTLAHSLHLKSYHRRETKPVPEYAEKLLQQFEATAHVIQRDLLGFFDYDTTVDSTQAYTGVAQQYVTWLDVLLHLAATGHLTRTELLTRSLVALRRDFRRPLLTWFKNLFLALQPTPEECLNRQQELVELLAHAQPQVVNFALEQLKAFWSHAAFDPAPLLLYAEGLVTRQDLKTAQRTLLSGFDKLLKRNPTLAPELGRLAVAALASADAAVQTKAAKLLASLLQARQPLLSADETAELVASLADYADLMTTGARQLLAPWLVPTPVPALTLGADYIPQSDFVPELSATTAVVPVADWHELLFLTGQVLHHDNVLELERWIDGLLGLQTQLPTDYAQLLLPYLVQVRPSLKDKTGEQATAVIADNGLTGHRGLVEALVLGWAQGFTTERVNRVNVRFDQDTSDPLVLVEQRRFAAAENHLRNRSGLPLLSTPSHAPYWVAPSVLVDRLLAYEAAHAEPDPFDLVVAVARTAYANAADAQAALTRLPRLQRPELRELLQWLLTPGLHPLPAFPPTKTSVLKHLTARLGKLLPGNAGGPTTLPDAWPWLWAVAARTRQPTGVFEELTAIIPTEYIGVVRPWTPEWHFEIKIDTWVEQWKPGKPTITHQYPVLQFPSKYSSQTPPSTLLLYSQHARFRAMGQAGWLLPHDYRFVASLIPHNPAPLHWHVVRTAAWADGLESTERDVVQAALQELLGPGPTFPEPTTLLLALGLMHKVPACRALALEVFLSACATGRLIPADLGSTLGRFLTAEFVPVQRLADNLQQARAIDAVTDAALQQVLDALLPQLPAVPLRNTKKLVELYADLAGRSGRRPAEATMATLRSWKGLTALSKAVGMLV
ncbi:DUF6493 family protein [Hymenobacter glacieicola]|uniref:Uncharacterized protein n=1 Tax=Hymenobacter glacieicola TaxID=1562124 RepID=A0ABQ1WPI9_9BACT|nr:DUF6493 family protein [Hymenobacter glacieicola]GGG35381.1 hypothetical protein GCM10011378_09540 [Hymenobacter glacieicola]